MSCQAGGEGAREVGDVACCVRLLCHSSALLIRGAYP